MTCGVTQALAPGRDNGLQCVRGVRVRSVRMRRLIFGSFVMSVGVFICIVCTSCSRSTVKGQQRRMVLPSFGCVALLRYVIDSAVCARRRIGGVNSVSIVSRA